MSEANIQYSRS